MQFIYNSLAMHLQSSCYTQLVSMATEAVLYLTYRFAIVPLQLITQSFTATHSPPIAPHRRVLAEIRVFYYFHQSQACSPCRTALNHLTTNKLHRQLCFADAHRSVRHHPRLTGETSHPGTRMRNNPQNSRGHTVVSCQPRRRRSVVCFRCALALMQHPLSSCALAA